jgi:DegV family protein with EDD domain
MAKTVKVGVVTDTTACLPAELVRQYGIRLVPAGYKLDGRGYKDGELSNEEFWAKFQSLSTMPSSNAVAMVDYMKQFEELAEMTDSIVCIVVSRALSATFAAAETARDAVCARHPGLKINVIDSKSSCGAMGFIALAAARAAEAGKGLDEVSAVVQDMVTRARYFSAMHSYKYMVKSGRAPQLAMPLPADALIQTKTIIGETNGSGKMEFFGRVRGTQKTMQQMIELAAKFLTPDRPAHFMLHYSDRKEEADALRKLVEARFTVAELYLTPYVGSMSVNVGPQFAIAFYN